MPPSSASQPPTSDFSGRNLPVTDESSSFANRQAGQSGVESVENPTEVGAWQESETDSKSLDPREMWFRRDQWLLASYAMHSQDSSGRVYPQPDHLYRGPFVRDRDRILHSSAFRRLSGKMQVFTGEMGTYHRTRLTHTIEVASVARTIARTLRLNEDLVEALALMHDIGHPPFGHCGEDVLDECMSSVGGFSHNQFATTLVTQLEQRYAEFPGLNLCAETLAGQDSRANKTDGQVGPSALLEVQIVDLADSIAYDAHDIDDAIQLGLLSIEQLSHLEIVAEALRRLKDRYGEVPGRRLRQLLVHVLIEMQVSELLLESTERLRPYEGHSTRDVCESGLKLDHGSKMTGWRNQLERFLFDTVYRHPKLIPVRAEASNRLRFLFETLAARPERLPLRFRQRSNEVPLRRCIGEYLAGMTDRFCNEQADYAAKNESGPLADW